jgi:hypothetical protein
MDGQLIALSGLVGAFVLAVGVVAGWMMRGAATDPGGAQARSTISELTQGRKRRQRQLKAANRAIAAIVAEETTDPATRKRLETVQQFLTDESTVE